MGLFLVEKRGGKSKHFEGDLDRNNNKNSGLQSVN